MSKDEAAKHRNIVKSWVIANIIGMLIGYGLTLAALLFSGGLGSSLPPESRELPKTAIEESIRTAIILLPLFFSTTTAQWFVLRSWIKNISLWIPASALGYSIIVLIFTIMSTIGIADLPVLVQSLGIGLFIGVVLGFSQWLVLRINLQQPIFWLIYIPLALLFCMAIVFYIGPFGGILGWALASAISGYWLRHKISQE